MKKLSDNSSGQQTMRLQPLPPEKHRQWDRLIAPYRMRELFHQSVWLDYLEATQGVKKALYQLQVGSEILGYFCGGITVKGPFKILGSPLSGWGTNFMGPIVNEDVDPAAFLDALDDLARRERISMIEIESRIFSSEVMAKSGYEAAAGQTYLIHLTPRDPEKVWKTLDKKRRTGIRKATKNGLTVEDTDDPKVVDEYFRQYCDLLAGKNMVPTYSLERPRKLFNYLKSKDMLFALRVRTKSGEVVATGLFPHDDRSMYFWGGASVLSSRHLCPNDLLHWHAMTLAAQRGIELYDMSGYGQFKKKFGGELVHLQRWHKCYSSVTRVARYVYRSQYFLRQKLLGRFAKRAEG